MEARGRASHEASDSILSDQGRPMKGPRMLRALKACSSRLSFSCCERAPPPRARARRSTWVRISRFDRCAPASGSTSRRTRPACPPTGSSCARRPASCSSTAAGRKTRRAGSWSGARRAWAPRWWYGTAPGPARDEPAADAGGARVRARRHRDLRSKSSSRPSTGCSDARLPRQGPDPAPPGQAGSWPP